MKFHFLFTVLSTLVQSLSNSNVSCCRYKHCWDFWCVLFQGSFVTFVNEKWLQLQKSNNKEPSWMDERFSLWCSLWCFRRTSRWSLSYFTKASKFCWTQWKFQILHVEFVQYVLFNVFNLRVLFKAIERNGNLPEVTVNGFYMPFYGAGRPGPTYFNPNKSYMGFIILAINHRTKWYTDPSIPFR